MNKEILKQCKEIFDKVDQCSEEYDIAAFATYHALDSGLKESLFQLVRYGPIWDGDVISKHCRNVLLELELAVKVCFKGQQGYNAATYRGWSVIKHLDGFEEKIKQKAYGCV